MQVLVVEDDPFAAELMLELLGFEGFQAVWARTAADALVQAQRLQPQAVLTDLSLPDHDGLWLAQQLRAGLPGLRFLGLVTGHAAGDACGMLGAEVFSHRFQKPVDFDQLVAALRASLAQS